MKIFLAAVAIAALTGVPALAQEGQAQEGHMAHHRDAAASTTMADMSKMTPEELHKHCSMMMGAEMQGVPKHDHSAEKLGHARATTKPTEAEMKAMHDKCVAVMAEAKKK